MTELRAIKQLEERVSVDDPDAESDQDLDIFQTQMLSAYQETTMSASGRRGNQITMTMVGRDESKHTMQEERLKGKCFKCTRVQGVEIKTEDNKSKW